MTTEALVQQIKLKKSFLCVGLDIDLDKIPQHLKKEADPIFTFAKDIIDATHKYAVAFKPNLAFFESYGVEGWVSFQKIMKYLNFNYPNHFTIADAKRGDIGNTAKRYAKAFFETYEVDSVTVAPYMGKDSVEPFLAFKEKHTILLALTSNEGAFDFQTQKIDGKEVYKQVLETSKSWENSENLMYVVGATKAEYFKEIRTIVPDSFLLVPGVGAQGGNLQDVCKYGLSKNIGLLINSSRGIIYASNDQHFAANAAIKATELQQQMANILEKTL